MIDDPRPRTPLLVAGAGVVVVLALLAGLVWFLSGNPDEDRNTSGFRAPTVTRASFCDGLAGFQADFAGVDPATDPTAYIAQVRTAADRLRAAGTPANMPAEAKASLAGFLEALQALPDTATARDVARVRDSRTTADKQQQKTLDAYLATECPGPGG